MPASTTFYLSCLLLSATIPVTAQVDFQYTTHPEANDVRALGEAEPVHELSASNCMPIRPKQLQATSVTGGLMLQWQAAPDVTHCRIMWGTSLTGPFWYINSKPGTPTELFIPEQFIVIGPTFGWRVRCFCADGASSPYSAIAYWSAGIAAVSSGTGAAVYPNPASSAFTISTGTKESAQVEVYDHAGRIVLSIPSAANVAVVEKGALPAGAYIIRIVEGARVEHLHFRMLD